MSDQLGYLLLSIAVCLVLYFFLKKAIKNGAHGLKKSSSILVFVILIWHVYVFALSRTGILTDLSFPPKFAIFMMVPAIVLVVLFLFINKSKNWIDRIPTHWLIGFQSMRIGIETLFVLSVAKGTIHPYMTIEGYNFDMLFALSAPVLALLVYKNKISDKFILIWNIIGLWIILSIIIVVTTLLYAPQIYGPNLPSFPSDFGSYPYVLVPGFLVPAAILIHGITILKMRRK